MRDVTEIDEKICLLLDRGSLVSCAKASKTWNRIVSPFVWRMIPKDMPTLRWIQFRHIVLEDYLQEIRQQEEQDLKEIQPSVKKPRHSVKRPRRSTKKSGRSSQVNTYVKKQSESHKPALITLDKYRLCVRQVESFVELVKGLEPALIGHDYGRTDYLGPSGCVLPSISSDAAQKPCNHGATQALKLIALGEANGPSLDWSWLWRACDQVKDIEIQCLLPDVLESIVANIPESMPRLEAVVFGAGSRFDAGHHLPLANSIGSILRANANKWVAVHCHPRLEMVPQALYALLEHASTLEDVALDGVLDTTKLVQVLASCPKLHSFGNFSDLDNCTDPLPEVDFSGFVDWNPEQNRVRPWLSKSTLETLAIGSIPQQTPWATDNTAMRLCKRLGEFINLRILQLGSRGSGMEHSRHLQLTLGNGVGALRGLRNLQELLILAYVFETRWLKCKHGGGLAALGRSLRGRTVISDLFELGGGKQLQAGVFFYFQLCFDFQDVYEWLQGNHPEIQLEQTFLLHH
ncbi:MAG: hypothetical protein BYD32DRAFT_441103 [Podila humilis]|nr:MAG: hypothetical protein BYD32DRAFT_441103 [Podila humilis]